ncbi:MAG: GntR family transcriptional regulator [Candidatus Ornithospirochaeta sp.]
MYTDMKHKITTGIWQENTPIPTESELCKLYGVSRITTRHALEDLDKEGFILRIQGRGTFVRAKQLKHGERQKGFTQIMAEEGFIVTTKVIVKELVAADEEVLKWMHLPPESQVYHFRRLRLIGKTPLVLMDEYVVKEIGEEMKNYDLENISFWKLYREIGKGDIEDNPCTVTAITPDDETCSLLEVPKGSAHLLFKSLAVMKEKAIEYSKSVFNAQYTEFTVGMRDQRISNIPKI